MAVIHVPEVLREKLGPEGAQALVELLNRSGRETRDEVVLLAEERFGRRVAEAEARFERRLAETVVSLETRLGGLAEGMASLETRVADRIAAAETRLLRWTFAFWTTQFILLLGILFAFFKP